MAGIKGGNIVKLSSEIGAKSSPSLGTFNQSFFDEAIKLGLEQSSNGMLLKYFKEETYSNFYIDIIMENFKKSSANQEFSNFIKFCSDSISIQDCIKIEKITVNQSNSRTWKNIRFGRITASIFYESAQCKKFDGSLVEKILGAKVFNPSKFMVRGLRIEKEVFKVLKREYPDIKECGIFLSKEFPLFGASPDAVNPEFVFEIKSPSSDKTVKNYIDGKTQIKKKFLMQIQLQMYFAEGKRGIFVVADPNFEENRKIKKYFVTLNEKFVESHLQKSLKFYENSVFPRLLQ